ncbi:hypothetical protein Fmac_019586 [Flemingia macrophylla]|uniref:Uncharacterized protein n=1 Tax=Flemingia macrophylla TaxID=520843 RepID=A0ABD1M8C6_9FABA
MEELWGVDRATGHMARAAREARRNISTPSYRVDLNDDVNNIQEEQPFDPGFDLAYRSPPHVDSYSPGDGTQSIPSAASTGTGGTSSSRGTKRKAAMVDVMDAQFDKLTTKLDTFTDYFGRGNDLTQRFNSTSVAIKRCAMSATQQAGQGHVMYTIPSTWDLISEQMGNCHVKYWTDASLAILVPVLISATRKEKH